MNKIEIIKRFNELGEQIALLDVDVSADEINREMVEIDPNDNKEFWRGYKFAQAELSRALNKAREKKVRVNKYWEHKNLENS